MWGARKRRDKHSRPEGDPDAVAKYGMTLLMRASKPGDAKTMFELPRAGMQGLHTSAFSIACIMTSHRMNACTNFVRFIFICGTNNAQCGRTMAVMVMA